MAGWCRLMKNRRVDKKWCQIFWEVKCLDGWMDGWIYLWVLVWPHEINISWMKVRVIWPPQRVKYFSFRPSSMCLGLVLANEHMIQNYTHINWMRGNVNWKTASPCFAYIENGHMLPTRQRYAPQVVIRKSLIGYMLHTAVSTACEISKTFLGFQTR